MKPLYRALAGALQALQNCKESVNTEWVEKHTARLDRLTQRHMPSGAGIDSGTTIDLTSSSPGKLVFHTSYHRMNECGMYDGWTEHTVRVYPDLASGIRLTISGPDRNEIKEYLYDVFTEALQTTVDEYAA